MKPTLAAQFFPAAIFAVAVAGLWGQQISIEPQPRTGPVLLRPFQTRSVPPARTGNSPRLADLMRAGTVYLTAQDAIALALENNIDIEVARYDPLTAEWRVQRSLSGGPLPGVPSGASQASSVASGQGVAGSQSAAGVGSVGSQGNGRSSNATVSQIGPVTQTLDPSVQIASTFTHSSSPQANITQSNTTNLISAARASTGTFQQGFLAGGNVTLTFNNHYLDENAPSDVLNPSSAPRLSISVQQNLLNGFGIAVNARNITVSKIGVETSNLNFRNRVSNIMSQVLNAYYSLAADYLDLEARKSALEVARTFEDNVKRQIEIGSAAESDLITAQSQTATAEQNAADSQAALRKQELQLKSLLSRNGSADPLLAGARVVPLDHLAIPEKDDLPPLADLVKQAFANRPDLAADKVNERSSEVSALGTRNGLLPTLQVMAGSAQAGLAGTPRTVIGPGGTLQHADPRFAGGIGTALGDVFRRDFASENGAIIFQTALGNHQAQSDFAIDQLQLRQTQLATQKDLARVEVDVMNYVIALQQARAQYDSALRNRILQEQLLASEQKKYETGASTPFAVAQQQRDLVNAQSQELAALVAYSSARIGLDVTLGTILEVNRISIGDVLKGR